MPPARALAATQASPIAVSQPLIALYHDDPKLVAPDALRGDAGVAVDATCAIPTSLHEAALEPGRYARLLHCGSYAGLPDAWGRVTGLASAGGLVVDAGRPCAERYLNTPGTVAAEELRTELLLPVV